MCCATHSRCTTGNPVSTQKPRQRSKDSASRKPGSPLHINACNAEEKDPDEIFNEADLSDSDYHPSTDPNYREKTRFTNSEDRDSVNISGSDKYGVPAINCSFNADPAAVDRTLFQRLQPKSPIWVRQATLQQAQKRAKDMDNYARKLMWKLLIPDDDIIALSKTKTKGVGFAKLFVSENFTSFTFKKTKEGLTGGKWNNQITSEVELRKRFISTFDRKMSRVLKHTENPQSD
ncbi:hypothetical protein RvY_11598 [Ramazzottius varieornatus]|uniref:Uncharacterized protein n=1 Tax=Ramazzottius varieornatus TaxID=947166 RepID=A0A1D1VIQ0_RAMVA|nr:hypothetical protein RvY_11598 [Ramazzottius varieornatus]